MRVYPPGSALLILTWWAAEGATRTDARACSFRVRQSSCGLVAPRRSSCSFPEVLRVPKAAPTITTWMRSTTSTRCSLTHSALCQAYLCSTLRPSSTRHRRPAGQHGCACGSPSLDVSGNLRVAHRCQCSISRASPSLAVCEVLYHSSQLICIIKSMSYKVIHRAENN